MRASPMHGDRPNQSVLLSLVLFWLIIAKPLASDIEDRKM